MFGFGKKKQPEVNQADEEKVEHIVNQAIERFQLNSSDTQSLRGWASAMVSGGYDFGDTLHNIYLDYGYPATLEFSNYWNMYRRFGIAANVVNLPADMSWLRPPELEGISESDALIEQFKLWKRVKGGDTRQRVGRYGGVFIRVKDGKMPNQPIEGTLSGLGSLVSLTPLYESQLRVKEIDRDPMSEDYGQPIMYEYRESIEGDRNEFSNNTFDIHPDRVVIFSEGADDGSIYGISALESVYNDLMDLRKINGGGAEGFYKNAAQNIVFDTKDAASAAKNKKLLDEFNENYDEFSKNRFRRAMWTPGLESTTLDSTLVQPKEFFMNSLNAVASGSQIPATILIGQQTGRLASDEDSRAFLSVIQSRRENTCDEFVRDLIDRLMEIGILARSKYEVVWDDLMALSDDELLEMGIRMADINQKSFQAGVGAVYTGEEIREKTGYDPEEFEEPDETLPDDMDVEPEDEDEE